jgi:hypothetical protein
MYGYDYISAEISLDSIPIDQSCRNWAEEFNYTLNPSLDVGSGQWTIEHSTLQNPQLQEALGYLTVENINVSGPITPPVTPHVFFLDAVTGKYVDATRAPLPVPVVVGEPITLIAIPGGTPSKPLAWNVPGNPIGVFLLKPQPVGTNGLPTGNPPPCAELANPSSQCAEIKPPDLTQQSTILYWTTPGTYEISYSSSSGTATARFSVTGPTSVEVTATAKGPATIGDDPITHAPKSVLFWGNYPHAGGVTFSATAVQPTQQTGQFHWVQVISQNDLVHKSLTGGSLNCPFGVGLDNYFFYPATTGQEPGAIKDNFADDNPYFPLDSTDATTTRMMQAKMFLLWQPTINNSIPVTLGYTEWRVTYGVDHTTNPKEPWSVFGTGAAFPFERTSIYPTWTSVVDNKNHPPCDLPQP